MALEMTTTGDDDLTMREDMKGLFTENETEEIKSHFRSCDSDRSGFVDESELVQLFKNLDVEISQEEMGNMVAEIDEDGNGLVDFDEFVMMMHKAKQGDPRFQSLSALAKELNSTPVSILQIEAAKYQLKVAYNIIEERKATSYHPKLYVMEVLIEGNLDIDGNTKTARCEAIGETSREAKFKAAQAGLIKMKNLKPGMKFEFGEIPLNWRRWVFQNMARGVRSDELMRIMSQKGFTPGVNVDFMQQFVLRQSSSLLLKETSGNLFSSDGRKLEPPWMRWAGEQLQRGIKGSMVLAELERLGYKAERNPHLTQQLVKQMLPGHCSPTASPHFDFWSTLAEGNLQLIRWFILGGANANADKLDRHKRIASTPLLVAARHGHSKVIEFLIQEGADLERADSYGRTPLLTAAKFGHLESVSELLKGDANVLHGDNFGNTALHFAAIGNHIEIISELLRHNETCVQNCVLNITPVTPLHFRTVLIDLFDEIMTTRLQSNEKRRFPTSWFYDAALLAYNKMQPLELKRLPFPKPERSVTDYILTRYLPPKSQDDEIPDALKLQYFIEQVFLQSFINGQNRQSRTALHLACDENLVCSHENTIRVLVDRYGCNVTVRDCTGRTPFDYIVAKRGRPGSATGSKDIEDELTERRVKHRELFLENQSKEERERKKQEWKNYLLDYSDAIEDSSDQKEALIERSIFHREFRGWKEYEDTFTRNRLYVNNESGNLQWETPKEIVRHSTLERRWSKRRSSSKMLQREGSWHVYCDLSTKNVFFYNEECGEHQWKPPAEIDGWENSDFITENTRESSDEESSDDEFDDDDDQHESELISIVGEWEEHENTKLGIRFYKNTKTGVKTWSAPSEMVEQKVVKQAYSLMRERSAVVGTIGDWSKMYHPVSGQEFFFNVKTGEGRDETEEPESFRHARTRKKAVGAEDRKMLDALQRARKKEERKQKREAGEPDSDEETDVVAEMKAKNKRKLEELNEKIIAKIREAHTDDGLAYQEIRVQLETSTVKSAHDMGIYVSTGDRIETTRVPDVVQELEQSEEDSKRVEDRMSSPRTKERRRLVRLLEYADIRMKKQMALCFWGCRLWYPLGAVKDKHETEECVQRLMSCRLGCGKIIRHHEWLRAHRSSNYRNYLTFHEADECPVRLRQCPRDCGIWVSLNGMEHHKMNLCMKRPISNMYCRLKCGKKFEGGSNKVIELETERMLHEVEECVNRLVPCPWSNCGEKVRAKERRAHRQKHINEVGLTTFNTAGEHLYKVPSNVKWIKIQAWGAGGGSGHLRRQKCGHGGGGAFIEGILLVSSKETLRLTIGSGGGGGKPGTLVESEDQTTELMVNVIGTSRPGEPGGGVGHSGNREWACGAGGGMTTLSRSTAFGPEVILIAGGGGGGGCRDGLAGSGLEGVNIPEDLTDARNGGTATTTEGGTPGQNLKYSDCTLEATAGELYQGGNGATFGGGGGGGYYGGGGGGCSPGIVGSGGGGSSYVNEALFKEKPITMAGTGRTPGGIDRQPPSAAGVAEWDTLPGVSGEGAKGSKYRVQMGNPGCIRIAVPGFFNNLGYGCDDIEMVSSDMSPRSSLLSRASTTKG